MKKKLNKKGFTLMEMLIVVAIISILVAIAIPNFSNATKAAQEAADKADARIDTTEQIINDLLASASNTNP